LQQKPKPPELQDLELLSVYVRYDEANIWLSILEFIGGLFHPLHFLIGSLFIASGLIFVATGVLSGTLENYEIAFDAASSDSFFLFLAAATLYAGSVPILALLPWLIRGHALGFGGETLLDNVLNQIVVERRPSNIADSISVQVHPNSATRLRHSSFFDDGVCNVVAQWIVARRVEQCDSAGYGKLITNLV
jgi:hypothetical protein